MTFNKRNATARRARKEIEMLKFNEIEVQYDCADTYIGSYRPDDKIEQVIARVLSDQTDEMKRAVRVYFKNIEEANERAEKARTDFLIRALLKADIEIDPVTTPLPARYV